MPLNLLVYPCAFHHFWDALSAYDYMRERIVPGEQIPESFMREKHWWGRSDELAGWLLDAALSLDSYKLGIARPILVNVCGEMELLGETFIFRFTDELVLAARANCQPLKEGQAHTLLYFFYCKAVVEIVGRFDRLVMEASAGLSSFKAYCVENRYRWLQFAELIDKELEGLDELPWAASNVRPAIFATARRLADLWDTSVQLAAEKLQARHAQPYAQ